MSNHLSKGSVYGIVIYILVMPLLINLDPMYYLTLGFILMNYIMARDITPDLFVKIEKRPIVRLTYILISSVTFSALVVGGIYYVSFYLIP